MTHLRTFTTALALLALLLGGAAFAQDDAAASDAAPADAPPAGDTVVLRVGDTEVTYDAFQDRFDIAMRGLAAQQGVQLTPDVRARLAALAPQFLEQRAREVALIQAARDRGIEVSEEEIDAQVEEIRAGVPDEAGFENLLEASGIGSVEMLRTLVREDALVGALQRRIESEQSVADEDVRAAYEERSEEFQVGERVCASHILVETAEEAETALAEIREGTPFADVAAERGTDATATRGGELGCFERGRMVPAFEEAVFDPEAEVGEAFGPVETEFGHHLIQITERQEARTLPFEDVEEQVRADLLEQSVQDELVSVIEASGIETFPERLPQPAPAAGGEGAQPTAPEGAPADPAAPEGDAEAAPETGAEDTDPAAPEGDVTEPAEPEGGGEGAEPAAPEGEAAD